MLAKIGARFYRSIPLIPVYCSLFIFIAVFSPITWGASGFITKALLLALGLGIACAYSTTIFVDEYLKKD
ncbi:MAG TPA: hypothetical protein VGJ90_04135 [Methylophilaceae bacterium]|jgi:hypothetical protein